MQVEIKQSLAKRIGYDKLAEFKLDPKQWYSSSVTRCFSLASLTKDQVARLEKLLQAHKRVRGVSEILSNIEIWRAAMSDPERAVARSCVQFSVLLKSYLAEIPGHRVYQN